MGSSFILVSHMMSVLFWVAFLGCWVRMVVATGSTSAEDAITPATDCSMPENTIVSDTNCSYYDEQNMDGLLGGCRDFLTNIQNAPTHDCCTAFTYVAYTHTACLCKAIFYPFDSTVDAASSTVNATRQKELPGLCLIKINFCNVCLNYLSSSPQTGSGSSAKSHRNTGILTVLKVLIPLLIVVGVTVTIAAMVYRRYKARKMAAAAKQQTYVGSVPGGAF